MTQQSKKKTYEIASLILPAKQTEENKQNCSSSQPSSSTICDELTTCSTISSPPTIRPQKDSQKTRREKNTERMRKNRKDPSFKSQEYARVKIRRQLRKLEIQDSNRLLNKQANNSTRQFSKKSVTQFDFLKTYNENIQKAFDYVCNCCSGLFFERTVISFDIESLVNNGRITSNEVFCAVAYGNWQTGGKRFLCVTCYEQAIYRKKVINC
jgi:hypothetical protein